MGSGEGLDRGYRWGAGAAGERAGVVPHRGPCTFGPQRPKLLPPPLPFLLILKDDTAVSSRASLGFGQSRSILRWSTHLASENERCQYVSTICIDRAGRDVVGQTRLFAPGAPGTTP
jgi:hypothetical protein